MRNLLKKTIISTVVALALSAGVATTANAEVTRLSGKNRYFISDAIVKAGWSTGAATAAVLASGLDANTVDVLTVAPLAKANNAPVVLVDPKDSIATIVSKFTALNTKTVYIANGTGVISTEIEEGLKAAGIATVYRLGGADRFKTALNIAKELGASTSIVVASGKDAHLVDSLSIAPIAGAKKMPIFLAGSSLDTATTAYINSMGAKTTYVIGGTDTVADSAVSALPGVTRLSGDGRYETNAKVIDAFKTDVVLNLNNIFIASGEDVNLIDSAVGAPLAALKGAPIIFVHNIINSDINTLLKSIVNGTTKITVLGGIAAVTPTATYAIDTIKTGIDNDTAVTFPDKNLEQVIRNITNKPSGSILKSDVEKITILSAYDKNINDLAGIENLTNLFHLELTYNQISNIEPLEGLTNLTELLLYNNQITNIEPLKGLTNLTYLYLDSNQITNIESLRGLTNLNYLYLNSNQISNIEPLKGLTNLTQLYLHSNQLSNVEPLNRLTGLLRLVLSDNQISNIEPLQGLTSLKQLYLDSNQLSNIEPLKGLNLNLLVLDHNLVPLKGFDYTIPPDYVS